MKSIISVGFLVILFVFGIAQERPTTLAGSSVSRALTTTPVLADSGAATPAQDSVTEEDLNALLDKISQTSVELKKAEETLEELKPQIISFVGKRNTHDANRCSFPEGHPEVCAAYEEERLNLEK